MTDSINYKFDVPKEFMIPMCEDEFGLQVFMSLHSQFVYRSKAIAKLYTFVHLITQQRLKPKHMLRVLFKTLRVFLELSQSKIHVTFTITELIVPNATMKLQSIVCQ